MRILHILDHSLPYFSGYSFRTNAILRHQLECGLQPIALTSPKHSDGNAAYDEINGIKYYRCRFPDTAIRRQVTSIPFVREQLQMSMMQRFIENFLEKNKIDVLHAHSPSLNGIPAVKAARRYGIPVVYEVRAFWEDAAVDHGTFAQQSLKYRISSKVESWLFRRVSAITTLGESMRKEIMGRGVAAAKVHVFPNGVDLGHFLPRKKKLPLIESHGLQDKLILGFIGSFYRYEGIDLLVRALKNVVSAVPEVALMLVGDGVQRAELRALVRELDIEKHVIFTGKVPHDEVADYYSIMDIMVYPRKSMRLTELVTPLKPLEAMAMGKIVLGSDVGGIKELVNDGMTGFLFKANNVDALADKCKMLINDKKLRAVVSGRAREYVENERAWPKIVSKYSTLYGSLLENPQSGTVKALDSSVHAH